MEKTDQVNADKNLGTTDSDRKTEQPVRDVIVYLASRNSSGVHKEVLRVDANNRVRGKGLWKFLPWGFLSDVGTNRDWRTAHCFFSLEEAKADYVALEKRRIKTAEKALKQVAA